MKKLMMVIGLSLVVGLLLSGCGGKKSPLGPSEPLLTSEQIAQIDITFVSIPGGTFQMGDVESEDYSNEKPVHTVTLSGFEMSVYEITNSQYAKYLNDALKTGDIEVVRNGAVYGKTGTWAGQFYLPVAFVFPGGYGGQYFIAFNNETFWSFVVGQENVPVFGVTWYGAKAFALYYGFDLPTEAEWEYACRGGRQYKYGTDDGTINSTKANYDWNIRHPVDVGRYLSNPYGLHDMSGNVAEWCHDWEGKYTSGSQMNPTGAQTGDLRIMRGGGWQDEERFCRSAFRYYGEPDKGYSNLGFRVVRRASPQNY